MSITVTVITTANRVRRFTLNDQNSVDTLLERLKRSAQYFSGKPLIIGSAQHTEIFSASSMACVEFETTADLSAYLPLAHDLTITALTREQELTPFTGGLNGDHFTARIDFFFEGGHALHTRAEGVRKPALAERLMNLTSIFERPVIIYHLPQGGIGLMNPHCMTRSVVTPGVPDLPRDALLAVSDPSAEQ